MRRRIGEIAVAVHILLPPGAVHAESKLVPVMSLPLWEKPASELTPAEETQRRLHGIRMSMLHPGVWATLKTERTHNARIVPIKRYFLRRSEEPGFRVRSIHVTYNFGRALKDQIDRQPHELDPLLEIGFGGKVSDAGETGYALRLSGIAGVPSGFYYRLNGRYHLLAAGTPDRVGAFKPYALLLEVEPGGITATLDGRPFAHFSGDDLDSGLVSLVAGWHPVYLTGLEVSGTVQEGGKAVDIRESGLVAGDVGGK